VVSGGQLQSAIVQIEVAGGKRTDKEDTAMRDGDGLIQMLMTPIGLAVTAAAAGALFLFARWVITV
jgi:hypothetical protein